MLFGCYAFVACLADFTILWWDERAAAAKAMAGGVRRRMNFYEFLWKQQRVEEREGERVSESRWLKQTWSSFHCIQRKNWNKKTFLLSCSSIFGILLSIHQRCYSMSKLEKSFIREFISSSAQNFFPLSLGSWDFRMEISFCTSTEKKKRLYSRMRIFRN